MGVGPRFKTGKITITTAQVTAGVVNVICGFTPQYAKVVNESAITAEVITTEKWAAMPDLTSLLTTTDAGTSITTTLGLSNFDDDAISQDGTALTVGTSLDVTEGSPTVTGVGTLFTTEVEVGDRVKVGNELLEIASIASALSMDATSDWGTTNGPDAATVFSPGAEVEASGGVGFTVLLANEAAGEVLYYSAMTSQFETEDATVA